MRLFLGIPIEGQLHSELSRFVSDLSVRFGMIRWTRPENLHVTMRFFGDVDPGEVEVLRSTYAEAVRSVPRGELKLDRTGIFSHRDRMVFWAGLDSADWIAELGQKLSNEPRPFSAHVTLGKFSGKRSIPLKNFLLEFEAARLPATVQSPCRLVLFESRSGPKGAVYREIADL